MPKPKRSLKSSSTKASTSSKKQKSKSIISLKVHPSLQGICRRVLALAAPPPDLTVSQWADKFRVLPQEGSAEHGQWDTSRAEYQREPMDAYTDPRVHTMVLKWASQLGKSEVILNCIGYSIHYDPSPMLMVQPDKDNAKDFAEDRIDTMIRDTPVLSEAVFPTRGGAGKKNSGTFKKNFRGGYLAIASANIPASLAGKPIKRVFADEVDRYKASAGSEGDPVGLASKRTTTFWDKKELLTSTPGNRGESRIDGAYEQSDQRQCFVPCPHCGAYQTLKWQNVQWDKEVVDGRKVHKPETVRMICEGCEEALYEADKFYMIPQGKWIAQAEFHGIIGWELNTLYSPWFPWEKMVREFIEAQGKPEELKVFVNTRLGESWVEDGETIESDDLYHRRERYPAQIPLKGFILTAGVDIQQDRIEVLVKAWGQGEECWCIQHAVLWGDTQEKAVWRELEYFLDGEWIHQNGAKFRLSSTCIDSGFNTQMVYDFCRGKTAGRIFATKGIAGEGQPVVSSPSAKRTGKNERPVELFMIGVDSTKEIIYLRLKRTEPGPGYFHFPEHYTEEYFKQLTAEKLVKKYERGFAKKIWKKTRPRNEVLDLTVLAYAALKLIPNWEAWEPRLMHTDPKLPKPEIPGQTQQRARRVRSRGIEF